MLPIVAPANGGRVRAVGIRDGEGVGDAPGEGTDWRARRVGVARSHSNDATVDQEFGDGLGSGARSRYHKVNKVEPQLKMGKSLSGFSE